MLNINKIKNLSGTGRKVNNRVWEITSVGRKRKYLYNR